MAESRSVKKPSPSSKGKIGSGENRSTQLMIILALAVCCFASFYLYGKTAKLIERNNNYQPNIDVSKLDTTTQAEAQEVEETESAVSSLGRASSQVMQSAMLAEVSGKQPFGTSNTLVAVQAVPVPELPEEVVQPPLVTVVAVMIKGNDRVAMIDVEGEEGGLVVREGSRFSDGSARITKINPEGVNFTWMKESYEAAVSQ